MEIEKCLQKRWSFGRWLKIQSVPLVFLWYWYVRPFMKPFMATKNCHSFLAWQFMMTFFWGGWFFMGPKTIHDRFSVGELAILMSYIKGFKIIGSWALNFETPSKRLFRGFVHFFSRQMEGFILVDMLWKWNVIFSRFLGVHWTWSSYVWWGMVLVALGFPWV